MFKKLWETVAKKVSSSSESRLRGVDSQGIKYFSEQSPNGERRWFKHPTDEPFPKMAAEWYSWLHFRRDDAPTPELSKRLEMVREQTRRNAQLWEEEMAQMEMRDQMGDSGASRHHSQNQGFEFIAQQLQVDSDASEDTISHRTQSPLPPVNPLDPSTNEPNTSLHQGSGINPVIPNNKMSAGQQPNRGLAPKLSADMAYHPSEVKAKDPSSMSQEELREMTRAYSNSRTSRFLGVKPQIRSDAFVKKTENKEEK